MGQQNRVASQGSRVVWTDTHLELQVGERYVEGALDARNELARHCQHDVRVAKPVHVRVHQQLLIIRQPHESINSNQTSKCMFL
jgi:hypothetical protein